MVATTDKAVSRDDVRSFPERQFAFADFRAASGPLDSGAKLPDRHRFSPAAQRFKLRLPNIHSARFPKSDFRVLIIPGKNERPSSLFFMENLPRTAISLSYTLPLHSFSLEFFHNQFNGVTPSLESRAEVSEALGLFPAGSRISSRGQKRWFQDFPV